MDAESAVKMVEQLKVIRGETKVSPAKGLRALREGAGYELESESDEQEADAKRRH